MNTSADAAGAMTRMKKGANVKNARPAVEPIWWTLADVAAALQVSRRTLDAYRTRDDFPKDANRGKGFPRFLPDDIRAWAVSQREAA